MRAQPYLRPLIEGHAVSLDTDAQSALAAWLALRAIVSRYIDDPIIPPEEGWRDYLYTNHLPPPTCFQWIGAYYGSKNFFYRGIDISVSRQSGPMVGSPTPHGILLAFGIGYFAANLIWIRDGKPRDIDGYPDLIRIWPAQEVSIDWPPNTAFDDAGLLRLSERFISS